MMNKVEEKLYEFIDKNITKEKDNLRVVQRTIIMIGKN